MSRSSWKPVFFDPKLWNIQTKKRSESATQPSFEQDLICTKRSTPIRPFRVGIRVHISNGIRLIPTTLTGEIVGHRRGEFSGTRKRSSTAALKQTASTKK